MYFRHWSERYYLKPTKVNIVLIIAQNFRSSRWLLVAGELEGDDSWLDGSIEGMLLLQSLLGSLIARKITAIARSATATEFIGTESFRVRESTNRSQWFEKYKVAAAVAESKKPYRLGKVCLLGLWGNNSQTEEHAEKSLLWNSYKWAINPNQIILMSAVTANAKANHWCLRVGNIGSADTPINRAFSKRQNRSCSVTPPMSTSRGVPA